MKKADVKVGETYRVKVSGKVQDVQLIAECEYGGWYGTNKTTGRRVRIKTAAKLRGLSSVVKSAADLLKQRKQAAINKVCEEGLQGGVTEQTMTEAVEVCDDTKWKEKLLAELPASIRQHEQFRFYETESEYEEGLAYWLGFYDMQDMLEDFRLFLSALYEEKEGKGAAKHKDLYKEVLHILNKGL